MGPQHEETCFLICEDCQEITELGDTGLRIFRYNLNLGRVEESQTTQDLAVNIGETKEIFIVINTKDILLPTTDDVPKHVFNKIPCKQCRYIAEHAQKHLKKKVGIDDITGICDHCRAKRNSQDIRALCDDIIKKYFFCMCQRDTAKDVKPQLTRKSRPYSDTEHRNVIRRRLRPTLEIEAEEPKRAMHRYYSQESFITSFPRLIDNDTNYPLNKYVFLKDTRENPLRIDASSAELISGIRKRQRIQAKELERKAAPLIESSVEDMIDKTRVRKGLEVDHAPIEKKVKLIEKQEIKPEKRQSEKIQDEKIAHRREPGVTQPQKVNKSIQVDQSRQVGKSILEKEPKRPPEKEDIFKDTKQGREIKEKVPDKLIREPKRPPEKEDIFKDTKQGREIKEKVPDKLIREPKRPPEKEDIFKDTKQGREIKEKMPDKLIKSEKPKSVEKVKIEGKEIKVLLPPKSLEKVKIEGKEIKVLLPPKSLEKVKKEGKEVKVKEKEKITKEKEQPQLPLPLPPPPLVSKLEKIEAKDKAGDKLVKKEKPTKEKKQPSTPTMPEPLAPKLDEVKADDKETKIKHGKERKQPQLPPASKPDKVKVIIIEEKANTEKAMKLLMKGKKEDEKLPEKTESKIVAKQPKFVEKETKSNNIQKPSDMQELLRKKKETLEKKAAKEEKKDIEVEKPLTVSKKTSRKGEPGEDTEKKKVWKQLQLQIASPPNENTPPPSLLQQHLKGYGAQLAAEKQKKNLERELKMNEIIMEMDIGDNFQYAVSNANAPTSTPPELSHFPSLSHGKYTLMKILVSSPDDSMAYNAKAQRIKDEFWSKNFLQEPQKLNKKMIKDVKIVHLNPSELEEKIEKTKPEMLFQKTITKFPSDEQIKKFSSDQNIPEQIPVLDLSDPNRHAIRYALSDRSFIDKGWTVLPTQKTLRKMYIYRMRPARPEFDWFQRNKNKGFMSYDSGEKLAEFGDDGRGRFYYRNGRLALNYYDAEEANAKQRFIIYSSGEPDRRGRSRPITVLAMFDYSGNGIVFDHSGKIRLKYNQTDGVVLDRSLGPVTHWKWHSLNDPPVLQQVMIDTNIASKDPRIEKMDTEPNHKKRPGPDTDMLNIEFENFVKEKTKKLSASFCPYQIKMKALEINEQFSLRILNQATIYLYFHDGSSHIKLNLGMLLDHHEIIDTETVELGDVWNSFEASPAPSASIENLQKNMKSVQKAERLRTEKENRLRPPAARTAESADQLAAKLSRQVRPAIRYFSG